MCHQLSDDAPELGLADRPGACHRRYVPRDVELRIVEPHRPGHTQRRLDEPLAQARGGVEPRLDALPERRQRRPPAPVERLEDQDLAGVTADDAGLELEDLSVFWTEAVQRGSTPQLDHPARNDSGHSNARRDRGHPKSRNPGPEGGRQSRNFARACGLRARRGYACARRREAPAATTSGPVRGGTCRERTM
jgi:hypothetical protein